MELLVKFKHYIKQQDLFQPKDKLLLAVSGGVDSVVLGELCKQAGFDFVIAHCNFQLRGEESVRDEAFVHSLSKKYAVEVFSKRFDTEKYAAENKLSTQLAARELRYQWFEELLQKMKTDLSHEGSRSPLRGAREAWLLTAHHANDNIETLLMNFFKGTGIGGLHGILPKQGHIIRPLLFAKKEELVDFATTNKLEFVEDSSNESDKYTRNYLRHQLIPGLKKVYPQVEENLLNNIKRFGEIEILYRQSVNQAKKKLMEARGNEIHIPVLKLLKCKPVATILFEILKDYGFTAHQTDDVLSLVKAETGKFVQSGMYRVIKNRNWLIIAPNASAEAENVLIEGKGEVAFAAGCLRIKTVEHKAAFPGEKEQSGKNDPQTALLDADTIRFPLLLRKWQPGDYFYPYGMPGKTSGKPGKKKLKRFFNDLKLSTTERENTWVIEMDSKIIWVVGFRVDDRFKVTPGTKQVLQIVLTNRA